MMDKQSANILVALESTLYFRLSKGFGKRSSSTHHQIFEAIKDCDVVLSGGMYRGAYLDPQSLGIKPIVTDIANIDMAVQAVLDDTVIDHVENLH